LDNFGYLFAVYGIVWLVLFVFILSLINRQIKLRKEIDSLKSTISEKNAR